MNRDAAIQAFLASKAWQDASISPMTGDASARKYWRLSDSKRKSVLMDAPPPETITPFVHVQRLLAGMGLSVPKILGEDHQQGLLLLEDLGDMTFTRALNSGMNEADLYRLATDALIEMHRNIPASAKDILPLHDEARAIREVNLVLDWYWPALFGEEANLDIRASYEAAWRALLPLRNQLPPSIALFDFHVDNLMVLEGRKGAAACGLLDFQDAVIAPMGFDLASLLEDVRRDVPANIKNEMKARYLTAFPNIKTADFHLVYNISAAQRNVRIIGTFARLMRRDSKPHYQSFMPRVWRLVEEHLQYPGLEEVRAWFDQHIPKNLRKPLAFHERQHEST